MHRPTVHILCDKNGTRFQYVLEVIFKVHLHLDFVIVSKVINLPKSAILINYSSKTTEHINISIKPHTLLFEDNIYAQNIIVDRSNEDIPFFFGSYDFKGDYQFDFFAVIFYLISRYEEYLRFVPDRYGRFSASQSLAHRNHFLKIPLVDLWVLDLKKKIEAKWRIDIPLTRSFEVIPTFDIDTPYAFLAKPLYMHSGAVLRDIGLCRIGRLKERVLTLLGYKHDAFDTYDRIAELLEDSGRMAIFFFLMRFSFPDDHNFSIGTKKFKGLVKQISSNHKSGIHPSLMSHKSELYLQSEINLLRDIIYNSDYIHNDNPRSVEDNIISKSRQHFLKLEIPKTYHQLIKMGINEDFSMGYHDMSGFRASTSIPFPWFDLSENKKTDLEISPFQIMDATLRYHAAYKPEEAISEIMEIKSSTQGVQGKFCFIWHNSSFAEIYGWKGWEKALKICLQ